MAYTVDWMCAAIWSGMRDASTTRTFCVPYTLSVSGSTTPAENGADNVAVPSAPRTESCRRENRHTAQLLREHRRGTHGVIFGPKDLFHEAAGAPRPLAGHVGGGQNGAGSREEVGVGCDVRGRVVRSDDELRERGGRCDRTREFDGFELDL